MYIQIGNLISFESPQSIFSVRENLIWSHQVYLTSASGCMSSFQPTHNSIGYVCRINLITIHLLIVFPLKIQPCAIKGDLNDVCCMWEYLHTNTQTIQLSCQNHIGSIYTRGVESYVLRNRYTWISCASAVASSNIIRLDLRCHSRCHYYYIYVYIYSDVHDVWCAAVLWDLRDDDMDIFFL